MARTRIELVRKAADLLNLSEVGQPLEDDEAEVINREVDPVFASLARRNIVFVQTDDDIPDEFFNPLAVIVANNVGPSFGQSYDPSTDVLQEALLRSMQPGADASEPVHADYF